VVITVIGVLAAAVTPGVGRWMEDYRVRAASRRVMTDLQLARMKAVADNVQYQVYFNQANNQYWVQGWNPVASAWNQLGITRQLSNSANPAYEAGVTLSFSTGGDKTITFSSMGQTAAATTAMVASVNYQRNVTVSTTGSMQIVQVRP
jgi:Tfp pilus assembly protein FimT